MVANSLDQLTISFLKNDDIEIGFIPQLGGSIAFAKYHNIDFMRPWTGELTPRRTCCYPLVPFSNRIAYGQFNFLENDYQLAKNFEDHPHTIHGIAWQRVWNIIEYKQNKAVISYQHLPEKNDHDKRGWPFAFLVTQQIEIIKNKLLISMKIENQDSDIMPVGFGWHPFFPRYDEVELQFSASKVVLNDEGMLPKSIDNIPNDWDFKLKRKLDYPQLDNCFVNWQQTATISWPNKKLKLKMQVSENLKHLVVMTPAAPANFFAVEPVSHINNAINAPVPTDKGIKYLSSGESITGWFSLSLEAFS